MKFLVNGADGSQSLMPVDKLSFMQTKQAAAIADAVARLIPHEGVDYEVKIMFNGAGGTHVRMEIVPLTDKGEFWKEYVSQMIKKYPPTAEYNGVILPESSEVVEQPEEKEEK